MGVVTEANGTKKIFNVIIDASLSPIINYVCH